MVMKRAPVKKATMTKASKKQDKEYEHFTAAEWTLAQNLKKGGVKVGAVFHLDASGMR